MREHVLTRKGGSALVAKLDLEADRLLKKSQQAWLYPEERCLKTPSGAAVALDDFDETWQLAWKKLQGAWINKLGVPEDTSKTLDELWDAAWNALRCVVADKPVQP
jgi:hypothetical protein